jgi:hypothetical protein
MSGAFEYRPKFVDIRVRPPKGDEEETDVFSLKPGERACDHVGCRVPATAKAPKSRDMLQEHYWFCARHAAEYNKSWDFFAGMNEAQIRAAQEARATGERPTWAFRASADSREAASSRARGLADAFAMFSRGRPVATPADLAAERARRIGRLERNALADLDLEADADAAAIRARYKELVKRCHPDANGGDRSAEHKLQRVIKAYKTLQKAGMA